MFLHLLQPASKCKPLSSLPWEPLTASSLVPCIHSCPVTVNLPPSSQRDLIKTQFSIYLEPFDGFSLSFSLSGLCLPLCLISPSLPLPVRPSFRSETPSGHRPSAHAVPSIWNIFPLPLCLYGSFIHSFMI